MRHQEQSRQLSQPGPPPTHEGLGGTTWAPSLLETSDLWPPEATPVLLPRLGAGKLLEPKNCGSNHPPPPTESLRGLIPLAQLRSQVGRAPPQHATQPRAPQTYHTDEVTTAIFPSQALFEVILPDHGAQPAAEDDVGAVRLVPLPVRVGRWEWAGHRPGAPATPAPVLIKECSLLPKFFWTIVIFH